MRNRAFVATGLVIVGCWGAVQLTRNHFRYRIISNRHRQISVVMTEIGRIKGTLNLAGEGPASAKDLLSVIEINRLEGQIRNLRLENAIDQSRSNENALPEFIPLILLVAISLQLGRLEKKIRPESRPSE